MVRCQSSADTASKQPPQPRGASALSWRVAFWLDNSHAEFPDAVLRAPPTCSDICSRRRRIGHPPKGLRASISTSPLVFISSFTCVPVPLRAPVGSDLFSRFHGLVLLFPYKLYLSLSSTAI
jgi:hypothetical protein